MKKNKKKRSFFDVVRSVIMLAAFCVFLYSGYQLLQIYLTYKEGSDEYASLESRFVDDFDEEPETEKDGAVTEPEGEEDPDSGQKEKTAEDPAESGNSETESETGSGGGTKDRPGEKKKTEESEMTEEPETEGFTEKEEDGEIVRLPVMRSPIDFEGLQEVNEEVIAWLRVPGIGISYPVAQGEDNEYYLHRTFEHTENIAGCLFLNARNAKEFTDQNSIIYGHNMKNGSMFGKLNYFAYEDAYKKSRYFWIYTPEYIYRYRIFSCAVVGSEGEQYRENFPEEEYLDFLERMQKNSLIDTKSVKLTGEDRIVTLSTCTGDDTTRFILQGKLEKTYAARNKERE